MNIITIELCQEDRERLDKILAALEAKSQPMQVNELTGAIEPATHIEPPEGFEEITEEAPAEAPQPEAADAPKNKGKSISKADVQSKVVQLSAAGKKAQVREIVQQYGAKVSDIPENKYNAVWTKLMALEHLEG